MPGFSDADHGHAAIRTIKECHKTIWRLLQTFDNVVERLDPTLLNPFPKIAFCFAEELAVGPIREPPHGKILQNHGEWHAFRTDHWLIAVVLRRIPTKDDAATKLHRVQGGLNIN
jgi:hypothetical protein